MMPAASQAPAPDSQYRFGAVSGHSGQKATSANTKVNRKPNCLSCLWDMPGDLEVTRQIITGIFGGGDASRPPCDRHGWREVGQRMGQLPGWRPLPGPAVTEASFTPHYSIHGGQKC